MVMKHIVFIYTIFGVSGMMHAWETAMLRRMSIERAAYDFTIKTYAKEDQCPSILCGNEYTLRVERPSSLFEVKFYSIFDKKKNLMGLIEETISDCRAEEETILHNYWLSKILLFLQVKNINSFVLKINSGSDFAFDRVPLASSYKLRDLVVKEMLQRERTNSERLQPRAAAVDEQDEREETRV